MASTGINAQTSGGTVLPAPTVKLRSNDQIFWRHPIKIQHSEWVSKYELYHYPVVTAQDLSQDQIDKWVYVEMAHYVRGKSQYNLNKNWAGYVVPAPQIAWVNPLGNRWTRGGSHTSTADKPNHYRVTALNEQIPVFEYLFNRHIENRINHRDTTGNFVATPVLYPVQGARSQGQIPWRTFMYSGRYRPYYFKFRYIMWDEDTNNWISWPFSRVVKLAHNKHPFNVDSQASGIIGAQCWAVNPQFNVSEMRCWFETRLP